MKRATARQRSYIDPVRDEEPISNPLQTAWQVMILAALGFGTLVFAAFLGVWLAASMGII